MRLYCAVVMISPDSDKYVDWCTIFKYTIFSLYEWSGSAAADDCRVNVIRTETAHDIPPFKKID